MSDLCITYVDEVQPYELAGVRIDTIVSATFAQDRYFAKVEPAWQALRAKYNIPDRRALHFAEIKPLTHPKAWENTRYDQWKPCFQDPLGNPDYRRLHSFFNEVLEIIVESQVVFHATGLLIDNTANPLQGLSRNQRYSYSYQLMREHLDNVGMYLNHAHVPLHKRPAGLEPYMTKIRYDGDRGLEIRQDLREAFNHSISFGTRNLRPAAVLNTFDEIRFVNKNEVGDFVPQHPDISHAGADIVDFAALYIAREMWRTEFQQRKLGQYGDSVTPDQIKDVERITVKLCRIDVHGHEPIQPYEKLKDLVFDSGYRQLTGLRKMSFYL